MASVVSDTPATADQVPSVRGKGEKEHINWLVSGPFLAVHLALLALPFVGFGWRELALAIGLYYARMFFITAGYHRYFAHRGYKLGRVMQFLMALGGSTAVQKGVLWWAAHHRHHHKYSDMPEDVHSPKHGMFWSHLQWILCDRYEKTEYDRIRDFAKYPELVWLNKYHLVPAIALGAACFFFLGGLRGLVGVFCLSTVLLWHGTFTINSLAHVFGSRRYVTKDTSRNNLFLALITMGEGWHNNHHYYQSTANNGFFWWEIDLSYYVIRLFGLVGLAWDIRTPSEAVLSRNLVKDNVDVGMLPPPLQEQAVGGE